MQLLKYSFHLSINNLVSESFNSVIVLFCEGGGGLETGFCFVSQAGLGLTIILQPLTSKCWNVKA